MNYLLITIGILLWFGSGPLVVLEYINGWTMPIFWFVGLVLIGIGTKDN